MIAVVAQDRGFGRFPAAGGVDDDDEFASVVVDAEIVRNDSLSRVTPAVDRLAVALDHVADDLITDKVEVRLNRGLSRLHVVVETLHVA